MILLIFALISIFGFVGFFIALDIKARIKTIEKDLSRIKYDQCLLKQALSDQKHPPEHAAPPPAPDISFVSPTTANETIESKAQPSVSNPAYTAPSAQAETAQFNSTPSASAPSQPSLEETIGTRWVVYLGGIALALGGLLLARYAIEQSYFGPAARIFSGLILSIALLGAGEKIRRRETESGAITPTPAVLTAAGTTTAFGVIYAAYALYGFIGPGFAFVALGATAIATLLAALLHGPTVAGLGIVGALGAPLLVHTANPSPWPLAIYVAIVVSTSCALARLRQWAWLAISATVGAALWGCLLSASRTPSFAAAAELHFGFHTAIAVFIYSLSRRPISNNFNLNRRLANWAPSFFAVVAILMLGDIANRTEINAFWVMSAAAIIGCLAYGGAARPVFAPVLLLAAGVATVELLQSWPLTTFPKEPSLRELSSPGTFFAFSVLGSTAISWLAGRALWRTLDLPINSAKILAGAAALTPLATLWVSNEVAAQNDYLSTRSIQTLSTLAALVVAGGFLIFARSLRQRQEQNDQFTLGVMATACLAAVALGLNFSLDQGSLTVALALSSLGAAYVELRLDIPALRKAVCAMGLIIAARLAWDPRIVGDDLGTTPILNWLLFGYGVPAISFGLAARMLGKRSQDRSTQIAQTLAIVFTALLAGFEIRHAMSGGDVFRYGASLSELGLYAITGLGFSFALILLDGQNARPVYNRFAQAFAIGATFATAFGLLFALNPLLTGTPVEGGPIFNSLLLAYAIPAAAAATLANTRISERPLWFITMTRLAALALTFTFVTLETRRLFQGPSIGWGKGASSVEIYTYSAVWLILGIALLAIGLVRQSLVTRVASAGVILLAILKVFLYDFANLEGAARALSFICLGAVLIGIGLVYQKFVFQPSARSDNSASAD